MLRHLRKHKKKFSIASIILVVVILSFFIEEFIRDSTYFSESYGISSQGLVVFFVAAEIFFNIGIVLMLLGSGVFKIKWKDIRRFNFEAIHFRGPLVYFGFLINRVAALIPWLYILSSGWGKLPLTITSLIILEITIVFIIGLVIKIPSEKIVHE